jgi:hypothetical protein
LHFHFDSLFAKSDDESDGDIEERTFVCKMVGRLRIELDFIQIKGSEILKPLVIGIHGGRADERVSQSLVAIDLI